MVSSNTTPSVMTSSASDASTVFAPATASNRATLPTEDRAADDRGLAQGDAAQRETATLDAALVETDHSIALTVDIPSRDDIATGDTAELLIDPINVPWLTQPRVNGRRDGFWMIERYRRGAKRLFDIGVSATALTLLAVPMLCIAIAVKFDSRGPAIFKQKRVGVNRRGSGRRSDIRRFSPRRRDRRHPVPGEPTSKRRGGWDGRENRRRENVYGSTFTLYKFRSMKLDAEAGGVRLATKDDDRKTRLGNFLRKSRVDEWPQLWNVLKGEMSLVGPRPERPELTPGLADRIPGFGNRTNLRPGLTGLAQVEAGYANATEDFAKKAAYDDLYLQTLCLRNDLKILIRTVRVVLRGEGAN